MTDVLSPLHAPVAVDTHYIAKSTEKLTLTRGAVSSEWIVTLSDGTTLFVLEGEHFSLSHRKTVKDSKGQKLYQIRRETFNLGSKYYAETSENGERLWEFEVHRSLTGSESTMMFKNAASGGQPDHLEFKDKAFGKTGGYVKYQGKKVAMIEKKTWKLKHVYELTVTQGLDMSLIVGIVLSLDDRTRTRRATAAGAAGGGGGT
jgi:uncharacterized protein YxjI